jgi:hypothetical protein
VANALNNSRIIFADVHENGLFRELYGLFSPKANVSYLNQVKLVNIIKKAKQCLTNTTVAR